MDLTQEQLQNSVYYPACLYDLNPVLHLSYAADTFIYCDWKANKHVFEHELAREVQALGAGLKIIEIEDVVAPAFDYDNFPIGFAFTKQELSKRKEERGGGKSWAMKVILEKRAATTQRINLYYFGKAEGLRTYSNLFQSGRIAPRILVTVNSGSGLGGGFAKFESPCGVTKRFLDCCDAKPLVWIRGGMRGGKEIIEAPEEGFYDHEIRSWDNWQNDYLVSAFCMKQQRSEAEPLFSQIS
jgi:hypothetical protein